MCWYAYGIFNRMGLINTKTPLETEMKLRKILPILWQKAILFVWGKMLFANKSKCNSCPINKFCDKKLFRIL